MWKKFSPAWEKLASTSDLPPTYLRLTSDLPPTYLHSSSYLPHTYLILTANFQLTDKIRVWIGEEAPLPALS